MTVQFPEIKKNFGFGMMRLPMVGEDVDIPQVTAMADAFLEAGFNYFDTARPYIREKSELAFRQCVAERYPRDRFVLANKLSANCFSILKTECIYRHQAATFEEARKLIDNYIYFYNNQRIQLKTGVAPLTLRHSA